MRRLKFMRVIALVAVASVGLAACDLISFLPGTPRPTWCDPTDLSVNDGHTASFFAAYTTGKGPMSQSECQEVVGYLTHAAAFAAQYPTVASAKAAGWIQATVWTPNQGIHFVDPNRITGPFLPTKPNYLMYNGAGDTATLIGMMFLTTTTSTVPPAGFPGADDQWHNHDPLCYKAGAIPYIIGEHMPNSLCIGLGGVNTDFSSQWMVHVWLPVYAGWVATDIFNVDHPLVA